MRESSRALPVPRDKLIALAPLRRALLLPRRLSASECLNVVLPAEEGDVAEPNTNDTPQPDPDAGLALNPS